MRGNQTYAVLDAAILTAGRIGCGSHVPRRVITDDPAVLLEADRLAKLQGRPAWRVVQARMTSLRSHMRLLYRHDAGWITAPQPLLENEVAGDLVLFIRDGHARAVRVKASSGISISIDRGRYYRRDGMPASVCSGRCEPYSARRMEQINCGRSDDPSQDLELPESVRREIGRLSALALIRGEERALQAILPAIKRLESA